MTVPGFDISQLRRRAALVRLADLLEVPIDRLAYLDDVPEAQLCAFYEQVAGALAQENADVVARLAAASALLPVSIMAKIAQRSRSALFVARLAGAVDRSRAVKVARRLPESQIAAIARHLHARDAARVVGELPDPMVTAVAVALSDKEDWATLARFVAVLPHEPAVRATAELGDTALLRVAALISEADTLDRALAATPVERVAPLLHAVVADDLWPELAIVLPRMPEAHRRALDAAIAGSDETVAARYAAIAGLPKFVDQTEETS
ncbi:hypothetical protein [Nocardia lijiangensis]|uniref:hypothetical protein n=1 Tax=Nocardia lijiangensis TaxID=299618 RepID=UPI003D7573D3